MLFLRGLFLLVLLLWAAAGARAQVPLLTLGPEPVALPLGESLQVRVMDAAAPLDPDALWQGAQGEPQAASRTWHLRNGQRLVGRIRLQASGAGGPYLLDAPAATLDDIRVWHRQPGGAWQSAQAGDRLPLSQWPFVAPLPAFPLQLGAAPVDLIVAAANSGPLRVTLALTPDAVHRAGQTRTANLSGMVSGLGAMIAVVCLLGALSLGRRPDWLLAGVAFWALLTVMSFNGYMAVWLTPEWADFNDASKNFTGLVLSGLLLSLTAAALDPRHLSRPERLVATVIPWLCLAWGAIQWLWLPASWRMAGAAIAAAVTITIAAVLCLLNAVRGGRHVPLVAGGVACFAGLWAMAVLPRDFATGLDLRSASVGALVYASLLLFRQALVARDRYGHEVLGRAALRVNRDPQTALLSRAGFQLACEDVLLRQTAGLGTPSLMVMLLPQLDESAEKHGFVATERALVRFAAALQRALGPHWSVGRIGRSRFAGVSLHPRNAAQVGERATKVVAQVTRITRPLEALTGFDLRIACMHRSFEHDALEPSLRAMEEAALALPAGKRIVFV